MSERQYAAHANISRGAVRKARAAGRLALLADGSIDAAGFVENLRARDVTPHIAIDGHVRVSGQPRQTAIDKRTTRHPGYAISQAIRKRIEEIFGWTKTVGGLAQVKLRSLAKVRALFIFALTANNLVRLPKPLAAMG